MGTIRKFSQLRMKLILFSCLILTRLNSIAGLAKCGDCVFPFKTWGRQSDRCTSMYGTESICATKVNPESWLDWQVCTDPSCPGLEGNSPPISVHPQNQVGSCCKY